MGKPEMSWKKSKKWNKDRMMEHYRYHGCSEEEALELFKDDLCLLFGIKWGEALFSGKMAWSKMQAAGKEYHKKPEPENKCYFPFRERWGCQFLHCKQGCSEFRCAFEGEKLIT